MTTRRGLTAVIPGETPPVTTLLEQTSPPPAGIVEPWQSYFRNQMTVASVQRPHLFRVMLESQAQWINFVGMPGMGRTTVLQQIATELAHSDHAFVGIWSNQQASDFYETFVREGSANSGSLADELRRLYLAHNGQHVTLIIDDYDLQVQPSFATILRELFDTFPGFRLITSTLNPLEIGETSGPRLNDRFMQPASGRLFFTFEEARQVFLATLASGPGFVVPDERAMYAAFDEVRGIPLGVALAADRLLHPARHVESPFAQVVQAVRWHTLGHYPEEVRSSGMGQLTEFLMLMPRFKDLHIINLFPQVSESVLGELRGSRVLDPGKSAHAGEYVWADGMWRAAMDWNVTSSAVRSTLATKLINFGDVAGAFSQHLLVRDLAACERLLWQRFLTIYENLAPELESEILDLGAEELRSLPMLRALRSLFDHQIDKQEMLQHVANLSYPKRQRGAAQMVHSRAVACAIYVRIGKPHEAASHAQEVFDDAVALLDSPSLETEHILALDHRITVLEASLIAALTLAQLGTTPQGNGRLPSYSGIEHLNAWGEVLQTLVNATRGQEGERPSRMGVRTPIGYRSLVISPSHCFEEIHAYRAIDQEHRATTEQSNKFFHPDFADAEEYDQTFAPSHQPLVKRSLPRGLNILLEQLVHLQRGDVSRAMRRLQRGDLVEPSATIYESLVLLAQGQPAAALETLSKISGQWGHRVDATASVLRSCAHWRRNQAEASRYALHHGERLSSGSAALSLVLIPPADGEALVAMSDAPAAFRDALSTAQTTWAQFSSEPGAAPPAALTKTETETLSMLRRGLNTREIAEEVHVSVNTVRTHVRSIARKLNASGHAEILKRARELQLL